MIRTKFSVDGGCVKGRIVTSIKQANQLCLAIVLQHAVGNFP